MVPELVQGYLLILEGRRTMKEENDIGKLVESMTSDPLSDLVPSIRRAVERSWKSSFICGYIASDEEMYHLVANYMGKMLNVPDSNIHELKIPPDIIGLRFYFEDHKEEYPGNPESVHLVKALGFERLNRVRTICHRAGHDYDQAYENSSWTGPKILLITHIGFSLGDDMYEKAVDSATISQFKNFLWEIKK